MAESGVLTVNAAGIDVGSKFFSAIQYTNEADGDYQTPSAQDVVIRSNSFETKITVNGKGGARGVGDQVSHYGYAYLVDVKSVADSSYDEYGTVGRLEIAKGHVEAEDGSEIFCLMEVGGSSTKETSIDFGATVHTQTININGVNSATKAENGVANGFINVCTSHDISTMSKILVDGQYAYYVCRTCGYTLRSDGTAATTAEEPVVYFGTVDTPATASEAASCEHSWVKSVLVPATCLSDGTEKDACSKCGVSFTTSLPAIGHNWATPTYVWNGAQCTAKRVCKNDGAHVESETVTGTFVEDTVASCTSPAKGHYTASFASANFSTQSTAANSVTNGSALGHNYQWNGLVGDGHHTLVCSRCSASQQESCDTGGANGACSVCGYRAINLTHVEAKAATCTETGNKEYWYDTIGGGYYSDAKATIPTTLADVTLPVDPNNHPAASKVTVNCSCTLTGCNACGLYTASSSASNAYTGVANGMKNNPNIKKLVINDHIRYIATSGNEIYGDFQGCPNLKAVEINSSESFTIGAYAFYNCANLETVTLNGASSVKNSVGEGAFSGCTKLSTINYNGTVSDWSKYSFGYSKSIVWHLGCPAITVKCSNGNTTVAAVTADNFPMEDIAVNSPSNYASFGAMLASGNSVQTLVLWKDESYNGTLNASAFTTAKYFSSVYSGIANGAKCKLTITGDLAFDQYYDVANSGYHTRFSCDVVCGGTISKAVFNDNVTAKNITGGTFYGPVACSGQISGGDFYGTVSCSNITGGTFKNDPSSGVATGYKAVYDTANKNYVVVAKTQNVSSEITTGTYYSDVICAKTISGGTFYGTASAPTISNGTFYGDVVCSGAISGGTFYQAVTSSAISGGSFNGEIDAYDDELVITGGTFKCDPSDYVDAGECEVIASDSNNDGVNDTWKVKKNSYIISAGTFSNGTIECDGITGGTFTSSAKVICNGEISGGEFDCWSVTCNGMFYFK